MAGTNSPTPGGNGQPAAGDTQNPAGGHASVEELSSLRQQLDRANATAAAERAGRVQAERRTVVAVTTALSAEEVAINNALTAAEGEATRLEGEMASAMSTGNAAGLAKATRELSKMQTRIESLTYRKGEVEHRKASPMPVPSGAPIDEDPRLAAYNQWPRTKEWISQHPEFLEQGPFWHRCQAAHSLALADGLKIDTDDYFAFVEQQLGEHQPRQERQERRDPANRGDDVGDMSAIDPLSGAASVNNGPSFPDRGSAASRGAPPSRQSANPRAAGGDQVRLTAAEQEVALISFPDVPPAEAMKLYSDNLKLSIREGRMLTRH